MLRQYAPVCAGVSYAAFSFLQFVTVLTLVAMGDRFIGRALQKDGEFAYQLILPHRFDVVVTLHKQRNITDLTYEILNVFFVSYISLAWEQRLATNDYPLGLWKSLGNHIPFYWLYPNERMITLSAKHFLIVIDSAAVPKVIPCWQ